MNVNSIITMDYENLSDWTFGESKPNSNPIKPNFQKAKMNVNAFLQKDYENEPPSGPKKNKPNSNPILSAVGGLQMNISYVKTTNYEQKTMNYVNNKQNQFPKCPK